MVVRCPPLGRLLLGRFRHVGRCCHSYLELRAEIGVENEATGDDHIPSSRPFHSANLPAAFRGRQPLEPA